MDEVSDDQNLGAEEWKNQNGNDGRDDKSEEGSDGSRSPYHPSVPLALEL